jgi:hypothetical protein
MKYGSSRQKKKHAFVHRKKRRPASFICTFCMHWLPVGERPEVVLEYVKPQETPVTSRPERAYKPLEFIASQRTGVRHKREATGIVPGGGGWNGHALEKLQLQQLQRQQWRRQRQQSTTVNHQGQRLWGLEDDGGYSDGDSDGYSDGGSDGSDDMDSGYGSGNEDIGCDEERGIDSGNGNKGPVLQALFLPTCNLCL